MFHLPAPGYHHAKEQSTHQCKNNTVDTPKLKQRFRGTQPRLLKIDGILKQITRIEINTCYFAKLIQYTFGFISSFQYHREKQKFIEEFSLIFIAVSTMRVTIESFYCNLYFKSAIMIDLHELNRINTRAVFTSNISFIFFHLHIKSLFLVIVLASS